MEALGLVPPLSNAHHIEGRWVLVHELGTERQEPQWVVQIAHELASGWDVVSRAEGCLTVEKLPSGIERDELGADQRNCSTNDKLPEDIGERSCKHDPVAPKPVWIGRLAMDQRDDGLSADG